MGFGCLSTQKRGKRMLQINELRVEFNQDKKRVEAVKGISFELPHGCSLGVVGESGSGKSVTAYSIMGLLPDTASVTGEIIWNGKNLLDFSPKEWFSIRGKEIGLIFQNPQAALNPVFTIANQMIETIQLHQQVSKQEARNIAIELLKKVTITNAEQRIDDYPHQFSLGMCQRIMIALTVAMKPKLLIADEPTASLDVTSQKQILTLLGDLRRDFEMDLLIISHDLALISEHCDYVVVLYLGEVVEHGKTADIFQNPQHAYTKKLIEAIPKVSFRLGLS